MASSILTPILIPIPPQGPDASGLRISRQREWSRKALALCARSQNLPPSGWTQNSDGSPAPRDGFHWSVSHTRGMVAAVVATQPVGIDVELVRPRHKRIFDHVADIDEWNRLRGRHRLGGLGWQNFYRLWTAKEAVVKANGRGVGWIRECKLQDVLPRGLLMDFDGRAWLVAHHRTENHIAAVAVGADGMAPEYVEWKLGYLAAIPTESRDQGTTVVTPPVG